MRPERALPILLIGVLSCAFLAGLVFLLDLDASVGSGYTAYSSFRADPTGTKALFESLTAIPSLTVSRNFREVSLWHERDVALLVLGLPEWSLLHATRAEFDEWERLAENNRIVLAVEPSTFASDAKNSLFTSRWGLRLATPAEKHPAWRRFFGQTKGWRERQDDEGKPVVVERKFGQGSIVIVADSRFFTNQALAERSPSEFLSLVIGPYTRVQFDESHLGIEETGGVMFLARKYRLGGLLFGLGLLAVLFFWKQGVVFPVPSPQSEGANLKGQSKGQGSLEGFAGLLQTHLAPARLIEECLMQFRRTAPRDLNLTAMQTAAAREPDPLRAYSRIRAITQKNHE